MCVSRVLLLQGDSLMVELFTDIEKDRKNNSFWKEYDIRRKSSNKLDSTHLLNVHLYGPNDIWLLNIGAHYRHQNKFRRDVTSLARQMKSFPGRAIWREYLSTSFPLSPSGEFSHSRGWGYPRNTTCSSTLTRKQLSHPDWWRLRISNEIMKEHQIPILEQFNRSTRYGHEHKGWYRKYYTHENGKKKKHKPNCNPEEKRCNRLDCRHWLGNSTLRTLHLQSLKTVLSSSF